MVVFLSGPVPAQSLVSTSRAAVTEDTEAAEMKALMETSGPQPAPPKPSVQPTPSVQATPSVPSVPSITSRTELDDVWFLLFDAVREEPVFMPRGID